jgi:type I restriction enzyme R subunit
VGPLLRYVAGVDVAGATFTHKVERLKLQIAERKNTDTLTTDIVDDVMRLPNFVLDNPRRKAAVVLIEHGGLAQASAADLDELVEQLADQMRHKRADVNPLLELDLRDYIANRGYIVISRTGEQVYVEEYRQRVENRIAQLVTAHPTLQAIQRGENVSDEQLIEVERVLRWELSGEPLELDDINLRRAYGSRVMSLLALLRQTLDLDPAALPDYHEIVERQFEAYLAAHQNGYNADQMRFLRAVKAVLSRHRRLERNDLYDSPALRAFGDEAVERLFTDEEIEELLIFAAALAA